MKKFMSDLGRCFKCGKYAVLDKNGHCSDCR